MIGHFFKFGGGNIVRRFLLMPDVGRCSGVGDEKRSDSLDCLPRVV